MRKNTLHIGAALILTVLATFGVHWLLVRIYTLPAKDSLEAQAIDTLFDAHFWLISALFSLIVVFMLYSVVVFRRREGDESDGPHIHGNTPLEIAWTAAPLILVVIFGVYAQRILVEITKPVPNELNVTVTGRQWSWKFEYPDNDNIVTDELRLPVNRPINLELHSEDVNHAFWVPEFRVKRDLIPGSPYNLRITPTETGHYRLVCAELCGLEHANMRADLIVVSQAEFESWAEETAAFQSGIADMSPEERGDFWRTQLGCAGCHSIDGTVVVGPSWLGLFGDMRELNDGSTDIADEDYLRDSVYNPNGQVVEGFAENLMPGYYGDPEGPQYVTEEQIQDLIAFIKTLEE